MLFRGSESKGAWQECWGSSVLIGNKSFIQTDAEMQLVFIYEDLLEKWSFVPLIIDHSVYKSCLRLKVNHPAAHGGFTAESFRGDGAWAHQSSPVKEWKERGLWGGPVTCTQPRKGADGQVLKEGKHSFS